MTFLLGLLIIAVTVFAVLKRVDVRLVLILAAFALGIVAGDVRPIVRMFLATLSDEKFVVPICTAVGFAYVLRATTCDQHLVNALVLPLQRLRFLAIPGAVLVGFLVNVPVLSQTGTAVAVGTVLVPLMRGWRITSVTIGAAVLLGSSVGGELLNPGAPELRTIVSKLNEHAAEDDTQVETQDCVNKILPLVLVQLGVATAAFWVISVRSENRAKMQLKPPGSMPPAIADEHFLPENATTAISDRPLSDHSFVMEGNDVRFRVNWLKAAVPLLPIVLLLLTTPRYGIFEVPANWLLTSAEIQAKPLAELPRDSRLVGLAMIIGVGVAAITAPRQLGGTARSFFEGAGYAFTHVISLIVAAQCFGKGVEGIMLQDVLKSAILGERALLLPLTALIPGAFAWLSGSGMASTASLYGLFLGPTRDIGADTLLMGAVMSIASAAGRTLSPVAAVALMCASLTETDVFQLTRRLLVPLLVATIVMVIVAMCRQP